MPINLNNQYDIINIVDIPEEEISEPVRQALKSQIRYKDMDENDHLYNVSQILETKFDNQEVVNELDIINELCYKHGAIYFRIIQ